MPINTTHPAYDANIGRWQRCRDAYEGGDAVKARGKEYLPQLGGQDGHEYEAYKTRALFYEAPARTIDGFVGAIARKPPDVSLPDKLKDLGDSVTSDGVGMLELIKKLASETLLIGRAGILVDYDEQSGNPYLSVYTAESITNWIGSTGVVLLETIYEPDGADPYKLNCVAQYRELAIIDGAYTVRIWRERKNSAGAGSEWTIHETRTPTIRGRPMPEIPFFWLTPRGCTPAIEKPPLLGMIDVALSHYRSSADLEHGRHFTGLPTLWASGLDDSAQICVGAATVLKLPDSAGRVGYAEFTGQGLGSLERALESKERMMAVLGAAVFGEQRKGVEAAETAKIRQSGETSLLMGVVSSVEEVLRHALTCAAGWAGAANGVSIDINRDFFDTAIDPQLLAGLVQAYQAGAITIDTFLHNLQQAEMLPTDRTIEQEKTALAAAKPPAVIVPQ